MCGVSRGTVDRVLNNRGKVKPETEERIRATAESNRNTVIGNPGKLFHYSGVIRRRNRQCADSLCHQLVQLVKLLIRIKPTGNLANTYNIVNISVKYQL